MTSLQLDELEKAGRSMRVTIFNNTSRTMTKQKVICHMGMLRVQPPETIDPLTTVEFGSESNGMMAGTEAGCIYSMRGIQGVFEFGWNNPYFGKRGYKQLAPTGFDVECSAIDGTNCAVSFVVTETAAARTVGEIMEEKQKIETAILEKERIIKGIEKMLTIYTSQKDARNARMVEDEIASKQKDIDTSRLRMESLIIELEKKAREEDPTYVQQELQRVKEKIEAAVRVRKGIELMKDMYSSGSQKDPRQAQIVEQQVESKKREIDALRKFEQKLLDRLTSKTKPKDEPETPASPPPVLQAVGEKSEVRTGGAAEAAVPGPSVVRAKILFDVVPNTEQELTLHAGDIIIVHDKSAADWWEGELDGKRGYFPASYAEILEAQRENTDVSKNEYAHLYPKATVITEYTGAAEGELSLQVGEILTVYGWDDPYWWEGNKSGTVGFFPCHCVQWVEPEAEIEAINVSTSSGDYYEDIGKQTDGQSAASATPETATPEPGSQPEPAHPEPAPPAPVQHEPIPTQPVHQEPEPAHHLPHHESTQPEVSHPEPTHSEPTHTEPTHPEPTHPEPTHPEPTHPGPTHPGPTHPEPTHPGPTHPEPTHPEPTHPEPTQPEPIHQESHQSAHPEPTQSEKVPEPTPAHSVPTLIEPVPEHAPAHNVHAESTSNHKETHPQHPEHTPQPTPESKPELTTHEAQQPPPHVASYDSATYRPQQDTTPPPTSEAQPTHDGAPAQATADPQSSSPTQPQPANPQQQPAPPHTALRSKSAPMKPSGSPQTSLRKASPMGAGTSNKSLTPNKPVPRALPTPKATQPVAAQAFSTDAALSTFKEGMRTRTTDFANLIEHYTATTVAQYLDTISKLQNKVKELESLQAQTAKERDELKATNEKLLFEREGGTPDENGNTNPRMFSNRRSFWEQAARAVNKQI